MFRVVIIGGCAVDEGYRATSPSVTHNKMLGTSTPCRFLFRSAGGVGRNLADVLRKLLPDDLYGVHLVSAVGSDPEGTFLLERCRDAKLGTKLIAQLSQQTKLVDATRHIEYRTESEQEDLLPVPATTAKYVAILDGKGELAAAAAAMSIFESKEFYDHIVKIQDEIVGASAVVVDTNLPAPHFKLALEFARVQRMRSSKVGFESAAGVFNSFKLIAIDPISVEKGRRVVPVLMKQLIQQQQQQQQLQLQQRNVLTIMKPNHYEAAAMVEEALSRISQKKESPGSGRVLSVDELNKQLKQVLPRKPLPASSSSSSPSHNSSSPSLADFTSDDRESAEISQQILYEASRNAIILMLLLELDLVIVSCGSNGSVACFSSSTPRMSVGGDNEDDSDMAKLEFNRYWRTVPSPSLTADSSCTSSNNCYCYYYLRWFPPQRVRKVEKVTGAGDTFFGSIISHMLVSMTIPPSSDEIDSSTPSSSSSTAASEYYVWNQLSTSEKGQHIASAISNASMNASLALTTKKGATPTLVTLMGSVGSRRTNVLLSSKL